MNEKRSPYEGRFIEALDVVTPVKVVIAQVVDEFTEKSSDGRVIDRLILRFEKAEKALVVNKTNYRILWTLYGKDRKQWIGKSITLGRRYVDAFNERNVMAVRIIPPTGTALPYSVIKRLGKESC
jgi:hypothetical protein